LDDPRHVPVLVEEVLRYLAPERGGWFADCTVGLGGHAAALLAAAPQARLIGIDRDPQALAAARRRLAPFGARAVLVEGRFSDLPQLLAAQGVGRVAGILADLGLSSLQLAQAERGFAFALDGPLDMRMDGPGDVGGRTAAQIVNRDSEDDLTRLFRTFGEERQARRIARAIVEARRQRPIETTAQLRALVEQVKSRPPGGRRRIHPATQVFQALRIAVNRELDELQALMKNAAEQLEQDGRMVMISYHSLEDRIVKNALRDLATGTVDPVTGRPHSESRVIEVLTRKPVRPRAEEVAANPRARSARLRAGRRL